ncbi:hypothetical protein SANA_03600 [Gottschalkiaceae bacterium SANA]|nr:hypothetical protein SANA_03600 [Gottschalkiaceae bacterium SANA]
MREFDLYEPMRRWLQTYLEDKYIGWEVITTIESNGMRLDRVLGKYGIIEVAAIGVEIQIDVLGIVRKNGKHKLFFIEAKKTQLNLHHLGQLWAYCKLIDPEEAFLMTPEGFGSLNKILCVLKREDLLDFGNGKVIKKMKIVRWNRRSNRPDQQTMIPKV